MEYPGIETIERLVPSMKLAANRSSLFIAVKKFTAEAKRLNESYSQKMLIFDFSEEPYESSKFDGEAAR